MLRVSCTVLLFLCATCLVPTNAANDITPEAASAKGANNYLRFFMNLPITMHQAPASTSTFSTFTARAVRLGNQECLVTATATGVCERRLPSNDDEAIVEDEVEPTRVLQ